MSCDMLVKFYDLPPLGACSEYRRLQEDGYRFLHPLTANRAPVAAWVEKHFGLGWSSELQTAFSRQPVSSWLAIDPASRLVGFSCYEVTCRSFFGPVGVLEEQRGRGLGKILTLLGLHSLHEMGYAYAIIGWVDIKDFYIKICKAIPIPDSYPGFYADFLRNDSFTS